MSASLSKSPAIFGEVLFDVFPDGRVVMGGAPFNVAWHLQGFGLAPLMISAVGDDKHGEQVLAAMQEWGMDTSGMQVDNQHNTGKVTVSLDGSMPSYEIETDQAYDFIDVEKCRQVVSQHDCDLLYHGSLALRTQRSQSTLKTLIDENDLSIFIDINLRTPWWSLPEITDMLLRARWVKLNDDELAIVMGKDDADNPDYESLARECLAKYSLQRLIVTLGDQGAFCVTPDGVESGAPVKAKNLIDTVGAGDSFSAVMIAGLIHSWPLATTLTRALQFASAVCELRGATTTDNTMYDRFLAQWSSEK